MKKDEYEIIKNILIQCGIGESIVYCVNFLSKDILVSLKLAEIVFALEDTFNIEIEAEEIIPENFINLNTISKLVEKHFN